MTKVRLRVRVALVMIAFALGVAIAARAGRDRGDVPALFLIVAMLAAATADFIIHKRERRS
ncbi:hypothetical protein [Sphingomonas dokdonensis]|uniref:Uncharacterized protein n=1 Tax=Sphingomonas dokdonensis TaxID=344880 RepID=A0A245ZDQ9_9SPHN|nr:hypothetical protein [Sphingomonas dokdonensis]OWK27892.1 hypothetical protein SPDO_29750 [Sphingomonas dokdonensis]